MSDIENVKADLVKKVHKLRFWLSVLFCVAALVFAFMGYFSMSEGFGLTSTESTTEVGQTVIQFDVVGLWFLAMSPICIWAGVKTMPLAPRLK